MKIIAVVHEHRKPLHQDGSWGGFGNFPGELRSRMLASESQDPLKNLVLNGDELMRSIFVESRSVSILRLAKLLPRFFRIKTSEEYKRKVHLSLLKKILNTYNPEKPTVIWHQFNGFELPGREFLALSRFVNIILVTTSHDLQEKKFPEFFTNMEILKRSENYEVTLKMAKAVFTSTEFGKEELANAIGIPKTNIIVNPHSFPLQSASRSPVKYAEKQNYQIDYFIYPAKAWRHKGHIELMKAILAADEFDKKVIFIGDLSAIESEIKQLKHNEVFGQRILCLGYVDDRLKYELMRDSKGFVLPSIYEGFGVPYLEAANLEKTIIAFETEAVSELIGIQNIYAVPRGDFEMLVNIMQNFKPKSKSVLLKNKSKSLSLTWERTAAKYLETYALLLKDLS
jgi:glycosyltransferase involved in cell wall biosynthesis